ncbi:MAG TPA: N-acetyltransferase [Acidobacteriota bacterium]
MEIRKLQGPSEAEVCARMMADSEPWITLGRDYEKALRVLTDPRREVYQAFVEEKIVGFTILLMQGALVGYIQSICMAPEWRNRRLGRQLLEFAEKRIFKDTPNVFLCVSSFNRDARRWYARLGYEVIGELKDYIIPGHSEILMRKTIGPLAG